jgi:hypothetical protein
MLSAVSELSGKLGLSSQQVQSAPTAPTAPIVPIVLTAPPVSRSLSPVIRRRNRVKELSPMSQSFKKTLHVSHIFQIEQFRKKLQQRIQVVILFNMISFQPILTRLFLK